VEAGCVSIATKRRRFVACVVPASVCLFAACGAGDEKSAPARSASPTATATGTATAADETVAFSLAQEHRSGSSGTVILKGGDGGFTVSLAMKPKRDHPAHIHNVTCQEYRAMRDFDTQFATVEVALSDVAKGKSKTSVDAPLSNYRSGGFSINVHSYTGGFPVVACANIPTA
jgi:hypothetical protein